MYYLIKDIEIDFYMVLCYNAFINSSGGKNAT